MTEVYFEEGKPFTLDEHKRILELFKQGKLSFESEFISTEMHEFKLIEISLVPNRIYTGTLRIAEDE